jgi:hypothetical protein
LKHLPGLPNLLVYHRGIERDTNGIRLSPRELVSVKLSQEYSLALGKAKICPFRKTE